MPYHVDDHEDHLLFLVRDLREVESRQVQLVVRLKDVLKRGQGVHYVPVVVLTVLIYLHAGRTASHFCMFSVFVFSFQAKSGCAQSIFLSEPPFFVKI